MKLGGRRVLITGGSRGFGLAVARTFVAEGASVALCGRDREALNAASQELGVKALAADVSQSSDVGRLIDWVLPELGGLDAIVCSAGVYGPKGPVETVDWNDWVETISINLLGVVLLCRAVVPHFKRQRHGKIVILSGGGATKGMPNFSAYAASKAGVVRFAETLAEEVHEFGIDVNCVAPGAMNTRMLDEVLEAGPGKVGRAFYEQSLKQKSQGGVPPERGAALCAFLASDASDGMTGKLISAVWDPWETLPERGDELRGTDIYTLRRIVPEDRGKEW